MKRNYLFLVLLLLSSLTWSGAKASVWERGDIKTTFADGDDILLSGVYLWATGSYLNGWSSSVTILESNVIELEATGSTGPVKNKPTYYLKQKSSGKYYGNTSLVDDKSNAFAFEILNAADSAGVSYSSIYYSTPRTVLTTTPGANANSTVFCYSLTSSSYGQQTLFFAPNTTAPVIWGYTDYNAWNVYSAVESDDPYTELSELLSYYNAFTSAGKIYVGGTNPGNYPKAVADEFYASLTEGAAALETEDLEAYRAAITRIKNAKNAIDAASVEAIRPGLYYVESANPLFYQKQGVYKGIYSDTSGKFAWKTLDEQSGSFIWELTDAGSGNYLFKNFQTGEYISAVNTTDKGQTSASKPGLYTTFSSLGYSQFVIKVGGATIHTEGHSSGAGVSGTITQYSGGLSSGSSWYLIEVTDQHLLDSLSAVAAQARLTDRYKTLIQTAKSAYGKAVSYTAVSEETDKPLLTKANDTDPTQGQIVSNAKESTEGSYAALIDGSYDTYFHSRWSGTAVNENHYLQFDLLDNPVSAFSFHTLKRKTNNSNRPTAISIYATNDTVDGGSWTLVAPITQGLPTAAADSAYTGAVKLDQTYRYLRFVVEQTNNGALLGNYPFFTYSEFQLYPAQVEYAPTSQAGRLGNAVPELLAAINEALTKVQGTVTQSDYDKLESAYSAFVSAYVDTTTFVNLLSESETLLAGAEEGSEIGYYKEGAIAAFTTAVDKAKSVALQTESGEVITKSAFDEAYNALADAKKTFDASLIFIEPGQWYYIVNKQAADASNSHNGQGLYVYDGDTGAGLYWGGATGGTLDDATYNDSRYIWRFIQTSDSTYAIQNLSSGYYVGDTPSSGWPFTQKATKADYTISRVGTARFTIAPTGVPDRALIPYSSGSSVVAGSYNGTASSSAQWGFVPVDVDNLSFLTLSYDDNTLNGVTLPYPIDGLTDVDGNEYKLYEISGKITQADTVVGLKLKRITGRVEAGVPFIVEIGDRTQYSSDGDAVTVIAYVNFNNAFDVVDAPKSRNGLIGAFTSVSVPIGTGLFEQGKLRVTQVDEVVITNSAYVNESLIEDTGAEDAVLYIGDGEPALNDIKGLGYESDAVVDVYTTGGVLVAKSVKASEAFRGLKKGIYLIGKSKVQIR